MFWSLSTKLQLAVAGALLAGILTAGTVVYQSIRRSGIEAAERAVARENANAVSKATEERKRRERDCARDPARCLSDEWTRQP
jgi:hypothetical protein